MLFLQQTYNLAGEKKRVLLNSELFLWLLLLVTQRAVKDKTKHICSLTTGLGMLSLVRTLTILP